MAAKLLEIPAEILACIADELDIEHYGNLRLANRQIHDYTFPYFAKKFFGRRKFFRGHLSLSTLLSISESRLAPYLETLILGTELLEFGAPHNAPSVSKEAYYKAYADQTSMLACSWDRDTLADAMRNLPNLKGVGVEGFDDREMWDYDGNRPTSVVEGGYGLKTLLRSLGYEAGRPPNQASPATQWVTAVQTVLGAVARSGARPKSFSVAGKAPSKEGYMSSEMLGVDDDAFVVPAFLERTLLPIIEGLEELDLDVYNRMLYPEPEDSTTCRTCHLRRFLGIPRELKKLRIARLTGGMMATENPEERGGFWTWLGWSPKGKGKAVAADDNEGEGGGDGEDQWQWDTIPASSTNALVSPQPISLPHLRELHLSGEDILSENLTRLLNKVAPTLVKLDLHEINLRDRVADLDGNNNNNNNNNNDDDNNDEPVDEVRTEVDLWIALCGTLAAMPIDELREVNFSGFGGLGDWHMNKFGDEIEAAPGSVYFRALKIADGDDGDEPRAEFSYRGADVRGALARLAHDLRAAVRDGRHVFVAEPSKRRNSF